MTARWIAALALAAGIAAWARSDDPAPELAAGAAETAIARGLAYLRGDPSDLSARIVLDYLQRKYALPADLAYDATRRTDEEDRKLRVWGRFVGPDQHPDQAALGEFPDDGAAPAIEAMVMHALYCDRFALPAGYGELIARLAVAGDYELTHAVLAMKLAGDRGCAVRVQGAARPAELARQTRALVSRPPGDPRFEPLDVRYEALAVLEDSWPTAARPARSRASSRSSNPTAAGDHRPTSRRHRTRRSWRCGRCLRGRAPASPKPRSRGRDRGSRSRSGAAPLRRIDRVALDLGDERAQRHLDQCGCAVLQAAGGQQHGDHAGALELADLVGDF